MNLKCLEINDLKLETTVRRRAWWQYNAKPCVKRVESSYMTQNKL